ncbi:MAG: Ldh family oxidoreductase, partial [Patescibacteria group bacterium]
DMATSKRAWGEVRKAKRENSNLPKDSYYTNTGTFAVKPEDAYSAVPMGDYKGFALGLFIEIMTGSFLGREMAKNLSGDSIEKSDAQSVTRGAMILVFNPAATTNVEQFKKSNSELIQRIKESHALPGFEEIYIPGEHALKKRARNIKNGYLEVDETLWRNITG